MIALAIMARRKPLPFRPPLESSDQQEEREARITELLERAQRYRRRIEEHRRSTASHSMSTSSPQPGQRGTSSSFMASRSARC